MDLLCNPILHSRAERIDKLRQSGIAMSRRSNPNPEWTCRLELDNAQPDYVVDLLLHRRHLGDTSDLFAHTPHAHTHTHTHTCTHPHANTHMRGPLRIQVPRRDEPYAKPGHPMSIPLSLLHPSSSHSPHSPYRRQNTRTIRTDASRSLPIDLI